jgi:flagellar motor switch protein FliG
MTKESIRKAAVLIESLDFPTRQALLKQMEPQVAHEVQSYAIAMGRISADEREIVMREFLNSATPSQFDTQSQFHTQSLTDHSQPQYPPAGYSNVGPRTGNPHQPGNNDYSAQLNTFAGQSNTVHYQPSTTYNQPHPSAHQYSNTSPPGYSNRNTNENATPKVVNGSPRGFSFLAQLQPIEIALLLSSEPAHVQAVVLSQLPQNFAAQIIQSLNKQQQVDVIRRMASLGSIDPHAINIIAGELYARCYLRSADRDYQPSSPSLPNTTGQYAANPDQFFAGIQPARPNPPASAFENKKTSHHHAEPEIKVYHPPDDHQPEIPFPDEEENSPLLSFEQVMHIKESDLDTLLKTAQPELTIVALRGADRYIVKRVLSRLPSDEARDVDRMIKDLGPVKISEIRQAQQYLVELAHQLDNEGLIAINRPSHQRQHAA